MPAPADESLPATVRTTFMRPSLSESEEILISQEVFLAHQPQSCGLCRADNPGWRDASFWVRPGSALALTVVDDAHQSVRFQGTGHVSEQGNRIFHLGKAVDNQHCVEAA